MMPHPVRTPEPTGPPAPSAGRRVRRAGRPPSLLPAVGLVMLSVLVFIALSVLIAPPDSIDQNGAALPYNFKSERGSITLLSSGMLMLAAWTAGRTLILVWADRGRTRLLWLALTAVMLYFAVDEVGHFHEAMGEFLDERVPRGPFRTWNDVVVIAYGLVALPLALWLWREVMSHHRLLPMLVVTGALYVTTTSVDTVVESATYVSVIFEEGVKVCCSTFFALSMLTGLVAARWRITSASDGPAPVHPASVAPALAIWSAVIGIMAVAGLSVPFLGVGVVPVLAVWAVVPVAVLVILRSARTLTVGPARPDVDRG